MQNTPVQPRTSTSHAREFTCPATGPATAPALAQAVRRDGPPTINPVRRRLFRPPADVIIRMLCSLAFCIATAGQAVG